MLPEYIHVTWGGSYERFVKKLHLKCRVWPLSSNLDMLTDICKPQTCDHNSTAQCKTAVTAMLTHWSYCNLMIGHPFLSDHIFIALVPTTICFLITMIATFINSIADKVVRDTMAIRTLEVSLVTFYKKTDLNPTSKTNYIHYKCWDVITYPFQTSTVGPLKYGNGQVISTHILLGM